MAWTGRRNCAGEALRNWWFLEKEQDEWGETGKKDGRKIMGWEEGKPGGGGGGATLWSHALRILGASNAKVEKSVLLQ